MADLAKALKHMSPVYRRALAWRYTGAGMQLLPALLSTSPRAVPELGDIHLWQFSCCQNHVIASSPWHSHQYSHMSRLQFVHSQLHSILSNCTCISKFTAMTSLTASCPCCSQRLRTSVTVAPLAVSRESALHTRGPQVVRETAKCRAVKAPLAPLAQLRRGRSHTIHMQSGQLTRLIKCNCNIWRLPGLQTWCAAHSIAPACNASEHRPAKVCQQLIPTLQSHS